MSDNEDIEDEIGTRASPRRPEPDAYGQAALLLAESILHTLLDAKTVTRNQALETVRAAAEVKVEVAEEMGETATRMRQSLSLLAAIEQSLMTESVAAAND